VLDVPISFFFEEASESRRTSINATPDFIDEFLADRRGMELARHFVDINDAASRDAILVIAEVFARRTTTAKKPIER
jgi:hypothetical protein